MVGGNNCRKCVDFSPNNSFPKSIPKNRTTRKVGTGGLCVVRANWSRRESVNGTSVVEIISHLKEVPDEFFDISDTSVSQPTTGALEIGG